MIYFLSCTVGSWEPILLFFVNYVHATYSFICMKCFTVKANITDFLLNTIKLETNLMVKWFCLARQFSQLVYGFLEKRGWKGARTEPEFPGKGWHSQCQCLPWVRVEASVPSTMSGAWDVRIPDGHGIRSSPWWGAEGLNETLKCTDFIPGIWAATKPWNEDVVKGAI